ncbi:MAG: family 16 glycoside hydrolase, partial [Leeuwenhoekiella sp.]
LLSGFSLFAQEQLTLDNLNDFKDQAGNWQIVGDVVMNPNVDIHHAENAEEESGKKRKKRKKKNEPEALKAVTFSPGTGILLNNPENGKDNLVTKWEHGDIYLEMDVMLPKGSNSGIYLQGRYEVQLNDAWGVKDPKFSDIGGIYRNWENEPGKIFRGIAPLSNPSKAPGLWQNLKIHFKAPRFDASGKKIANAKFISIELNGEQVQNNVEVPLATGGPISSEETAMGPLMIQGDHGAVAFKNIHYQVMTESNVTLPSISYKTYKGDFKGLEDLDSATAVSEGNSKDIDVNLANEEDAYGIIFNGKISIPKDDKYTFAVDYTGGAQLSIDGKVVAKENSSDNQGRITSDSQLKAGEHSFTIKNIKNAGWRAPRLGFTVITATTNPKTFHAYDSYPPNVNDVSAIYVQPDAKPALLRGFVSFKGNEKRLSHTIGVGTPEGINYVYDLKSGNIIGFWRGDFVDATPMWHSRGDGSFRPKGAVQWTFLNQPLAKLASDKTPFPETGEAPDFVSEGYIIDTETGLPIFKQKYNDVEISNKITTDENNNYLKNEISFSKTGLSGWYYKLASGKVKKMEDGSYTIGDSDYYLKLTSAQTPVIRETNGETELIIPVDGSTINYEIIW